MGLVSSVNFVFRLNKEIIYNAHVRNLHFSGARISGGEHPANNDYYSLVTASVRAEKLSVWPATGGSFVGNTACLGKLQDAIPVFNKLLFLIVRSSTLHMRFEFCPGPYTLCLDIDFEFCPGPYTLCLDIDFEFGGGCSNNETSARN
ncbi:hypothetical protein RRG08_047567 [Elysia crispata]|uniref:Uncharacterized protein n=1 Tax=Elysia crispata TaxID=231223 RepID=A0AAE0YP48_9GAST|nr:hypothetical protein RRG08_047567 [Elysia crispata]